MVPVRSKPMVSWKGGGVSLFGNDKEYADLVESPGNWLFSAIIMVFSNLGTPTKVENLFQNTEADDEAWE